MAATQSACTGRDRLKCRGQGKCSCASGVHGEGPTQGCGGQGTRGAHGEHAIHVRDLGRVEAERLVERRRALPSRKESMRCGKKYGPGGVWGSWVSATQLHARGGPDSRLCGGQGTRRAHIEHVVHGRDLGRVEAERLVERPRVLPSRKARACNTGGDTAREAGALGGGGDSGVHGEGPTQKAVGLGHARSARRTCRPCP